MLADDGLRIYADDFAVGEGELNLLACLLVLFWLIIGWINHSLVEYQEVGVGGWQPVSLALRVGGEAVALIIDWVGHRQFEQAVWISLSGKEALELLFQRLEVLILLIFRIVAAYI